MALVSYSYMPSCHVRKSSYSTSSSGSRSSCKTRRHTVISFGIKTRQECFRFVKLNHFPSESKQLGDSRMGGNSRGVSLKALSQNSGGFVMDGEVDAKTLSGSEELVTKVLIPGLPDGEHEAQIDCCYWEWKHNLNVYYEKAGSGNSNSPVILFLPGFGVGSFHYEKQLKDLGRDYRVWALDFLGQGMSLPVEDPAPRLKKEDDGSHVEDSVWGFGNESEPWASELVYSVDLWQEQVRYFVEEVIGEPVYIVGNSLGGFVALYFAACNPHLVKGITLLNATPFWGFLPNPARSPRLAKLFPWAGTFPLPPRIKKLLEIVWQKISDPRSIAQILRQVYADHTTKVDKVFSRIIETTQHPAAAASFASIMFAPQAKLSFSDALSKCRDNSISVCLMYGKEDPWVTPIWGHQIKRKLPDAPYYEISPAGHCPHDEVPEIINYLLRGWIKNLESEGMTGLPLLDENLSSQQPVDKKVEFIRDGSKKLVTVRYIETNFLPFRWLTSFIRSLENFRMKSVQ
ncbi:unnamed protein product [Rhodiola kirilowii]